MTQNLMTINNMIKQGGKPEKNFKKELSSVHNQLYMFDAFCATNSTASPFRPMPILCPLPYLFVHLRIS